MSGFWFHPSAYDDLQEIWEYIAADNLDAADRVVNEIYHALELLALSPHRGHRRPALTSKPLRFILVRDFLIAYVPDETPVWVVAILHGRRNPRVLAAVLRGRS